MTKQYVDLEGNAVEIPEVSQELKSMRLLAGTELKGYNVHDVIRAGYTLEPLICLFCGSKEVMYHDAIADAYCSTCGRWQLKEDVK